MEDQSTANPRPTIEELLRECGHIHGHICPGQLLGVRMALLGCELIGITDPRGVDRKSFLVWVEIDRCMSDAVSVVTGASLGRRSLKFVDYGKVACTFYNTAKENAVRIAALDSARSLADIRFPGLEKKERQMRAYRSASDSELFKVEVVRPFLSEMDLPGRPRSRVVCYKCGEGVNDGREIKGAEGQSLCRSCAREGYYVKGDRNRDS